MSVAIFITNDAEANTLIPWGIRFARAKHSQLKLICPRKSKGKEDFSEIGIIDEESTTVHKTIMECLSSLPCGDVALKHKIASGEDSSDHDQILVSVHEVVSPNPETAFVERVEAMDIDLLLMPTFKPAKGSSERAEWEERLFHSAPCSVVCLRGSTSAEESALKLLFASELNEDVDDEFALNLTALLGRATQGEVTLLYVRPSDDIVARQVAQKHLDRLEKKIRNRSLEVIKRIQLADSLVNGINAVDLEHFDLVVVGTRSGKAIRQLLSGLKTAEDRGTPIAIMRQAVSLSDQLWVRFRSWVRAKVPQISRDHRVNLVDRLTSSSNFDFDFMALISLSTLIAALGLVQNSGAVVIGAMLVAPLMTPLVAMGLALVQANERLLQTALWSVLYGFSVALLIGAAVGLFVWLTIPGYGMGTQLMSRGFPNLLDLFVALASGVAAAYAMGRPNLLSALPGVAIAAALVPPIATSGVAFSLGHWTVAGGALLLFLTNIVAIVLGTAITFWSVGISTHVDQDIARPPRLWPRYWFIGIVIVSFLIAADFVFYPPTGPKSNSGNGSSQIEQQDIDESKSDDSSVD